MNARRSPSPSQVSDGAARHTASRVHGRTTTASSSSPKLLAEISLKPPGGGRSPLGLAYVISVQHQVGLLVAAQGLTPNTKHPPNYYALWLYNSPSDSHLLGFVTPVVGKNGQFRVPATLPANASHFGKLLVTVETKANPRTPGPLVLEGSGTL